LAKIGNLLLDDFSLKIKNGKPSIFLLTNFFVTSNIGGAKESDFSQSDFSQSDFSQSDFSQSDFSQSDFSQK